MVKKTFLSTVAEDVPKPKWFRFSFSKVLENYWYVAAAFISFFVIYGMSKFLSLQRRVRELELRPPVDDIALRGAVRLQLNDLVSDLEQSLRVNQKPDFSSPQPQSTHQIAAPIQNQIIHIQRDEELDQVIEIAKSIEKSLPDISMFANALKKSAVLTTTPHDAKIEVIEPEQDSQSQKDHLEMEIKINVEDEKKMDEDVIVEANVIVNEEVKEEVKVKERWSTPKGKKVQKKPTRRSMAAEEI